MELKKLIIHGFKSFADRVELTFEHGITGVVGPNGCGKSNISDAVRWVLGEQSAKSLRGAKMEDVIFNGTEKRRRQAFCEVTLVFDNTDGSLGVSYSEVAVSRRVYRDGNGEYSINGNPCRLKDVIELFRDTGIGRDGYSIVGQGRIDEILSQKSEDRRQVFEEAAGIMKFKTRKVEAERRLESSRLNLDRVEDILTELTERIEPLREQSEKAREYISLRDELKLLELNVFLVRGARFEQRLAELRQTLSGLDNDIQNGAARLEELGEKRTSRQGDLDRLEIETAEKRDAVQSLIREVEALEGEIKLARERIANGERERGRINEQRASAMDGGGGLSARIDDMRASLAADTDALSELKSRLDAREGELADMEKALAERENESEKAKSDVISVMNRLSDVRSQEARLGAMTNSLETQITALELEKQSGETGLSALSEHADEMKRRLDGETGRRREIEARINEMVDRVRAAAEAVQSLANDITELKEKRQNCVSRLKLLGEMQRDYEGYGNSVKQVLMQAKRIPGSGVHGVIADLIRVPERLERALDMVLGGAIQNIVVDKDEDAKRMIEYLRQNRFGRATFLPIASVRGRTLTPQERRILAMPGCVGLASELIEYDKKYQGVIDNLLGRTVIAENLDAGIPIQRAGNYQFRLVTLAGDVMHSGGSMTGGSVQSRVTNLLSRSREIESLEKAQSDIENELRAKMALLNKNEETRTLLKQERGGMYDDLHAQEVMCARAEENHKSAVDELAAFRGRMEKLDAERERLSAQLEETKATLSRLSGTRGDENRNIEELKARVKALSEEVFLMRANAESMRSAVSARRVEYATREKDVQEKARDIDRLVGQAGDIEALLAKSAEQLAACEAGLAESAARLEDRDAMLKAKRAALDFARGEFTAVDDGRVRAQKAVRTISDQIDALRAENEGLSEARHKNEMQLTRAEGEYKQLTDRIWEDYNLTYSGAEQFRAADFKLNESEKRVSAIRSRIRQMGNVNVASLDEFRQTQERVTELSAQRDDLTSAIADLESVIAELEHSMEKLFRSQFEIMNENFKHTFTRLFGGGMAELRLADPKDALNCGIEIAAQPPGKKLQMLSLLSGGERALTAIAILFAMLDLKPTPFCILDEIEAALDDANIDNFAEYLRQYSKKTQFVVITHRKGTMERCEALYGVVMEEKGVSKLVSVALNEAVKGV